MAAILVVDDLAANREVLVTVLASEGHRMREAANGAEALLEIRNEQPDLVITDVLMPVMDGYELIRQLRLDPSTSALPVVFHTAKYGAREARALALSTGVSYVLTKPAEAPEVLRIVRRVLSGELATGAASPEAGPVAAADREQLRLLTDKLSDRTTDLRAANARLRGLINIGLELASARDADRLLESVCESAQDLFSATYVTLGIVDRNDRTVQRFVSCGTTETQWIRTGDPVWGVLGVVIDERRTLRGDNHGGDAARLQLPARHPEIHAFLITPIASSEHVYGWMCFVSNEGRTFTDDDEQLVVALGGNVGRIYEIEHEIRERRHAELALAQNGVRTEQALADTRSAMQAMQVGDALKTAILDASLDGVVTMDHHGRITEFNAAAELTFGYSRAEVIGEPLADVIVPPDYRDAHRRGLERYLRSGEGPMLGKRLELSAVRRDGTVFPVELAIIPLPVSGDPLFTGFIRDITDRRRAEEEIRDAARLAALRGDVGLALTDTDSLASALQRCAEALVQHLGAAFARIWTLNEREGMLELKASAGLPTHLDGLHGRIPLGEREAGRIAREKKPHLTHTVIGDSEMDDQEWERREGIVAIVGHPLIVDHRVVGVMALFARHELPVTVGATLASIADHIALGIERHQSTTALRRAEERTRYALEAANVGIWDMNYSTGELGWSEILESHYGVATGSFAGTFDAFIERVHPDDRPALLEALADAMKTGSDFSTHHRSVWPDGTVRWLNGAGRIRLDAHGNPARGVGISMDVTERRMLEAKRLDAQKMEALGRMAGGVAHDFNNLLTAILGYCEILLGDTDLADPSRDDVGEIRKASLSAARLTRQLLAFSRRGVVKATLLDVNDVVADMRSIVERLIGDGVKLAIELKPGLAPVIADRGQVEQIVLNLAVNARDAMPRGGTLTILTDVVELDAQHARTHLAVTPGPYVSLRVSDTGTGMTPDVQARAFEPFFTTKEPGQGTGLGLATVHGIVTQAGGSIDVDTVIGSGTSFTVYLPQADGSRLPAEARVSAAQQLAETRTVLVVDDSDGMRELSRRLLQRQGYRVVVAATDDEAVRLLDRNAVDVLLVDIVMPGTSGAALATRLVALRPGLKVIYMSGYTETAIELRRTLDPATPFLDKPFTADALASAVREVLDQ